MGLAPTGPNCVRDCEDNCLEEYYWWDPRGVLCVNACPTACNNPDFTLGELGCDYLNRFGRTPEAKFVGCVCSASEALDILLPPIPLVVGADCICELLTAAQDHCANPGGAGSSVSGHTIDCLTDAAASMFELGDYEQFWFQVADWYFAIMEELEAQKNQNACIIQNCRLDALLN